MSKKFSRTLLLLTAITISTIIGGMFVSGLINPSSNIELTIISSENNNEMNEEIPSGYTEIGDFTVEDACCGHVDTEAAKVRLTNPPFNDIILAGSTLEIDVVDDNPMYAVSEIQYRWDTEASNSTLTVLDFEEGYTYEVNIPNVDGVHDLYVYVEDYSGNSGVNSFTLTITFTMDPPEIEIIDPSTASETLTDEFVFKANVTDDLGIIEVKIQIDNSAKLTMSFNATSGYYYRSYNVSKLTNGNHLLKVIAVDVDHQQHTVTESLAFNVIGGQDVALVSDPSEWDSSLSDLPENLSIYIEANNYSMYQKETGEIYFKIAAKDDEEIAAIDFTIYALDDFNVETGNYVLGDARKEVITSLEQSGTSGDWNLYEYTWDSTKSLDNYYLCVFDIQDTDEIANHLIVSIFLEIDNIEDKTTTTEDAAGLEMGIILLGLVSLMLITPFLRKKRKS